MSKRFIRVVVGCFGLLMVSQMAFTQNQTIDEETRFNVPSNAGSSAYFQANTIVRLNAKREAISGVLSKRGDQSFNVNPLGNQAVICLAGSSVSFGADGYVSSCTLATPHFLNIPGGTANGKGYPGIGVYFKEETLIVFDAYGCVIQGTLVGRTQLNAQGGGGGVYEAGSALTFDENGRVAYRAKAPVNVIAQPPSNEKPALLWKLGNDGGIDGGNGTPPKFYQDRAYYITELYTYHWNNGQGQPIAGTVTLRADDGTTYGPWQAEVVNKVYWRVTPKQVIPAGNYTLFDSDPKTWAQNGASNGTGMGWALGTPAK